MAPSATTIPEPPSDKEQNGQSNPLLPKLHPDMVDRLDADFIAYWKEFIATKPATHGVTVADVRANPAKYHAVWNRDLSGEDFVRDIAIKADDGHEFTVRLYTPDAESSPYGHGPYPIYINFHGGGWVYGDLTGDAALCLSIRNRLGIMVADVDYRMSPEHAFGEGHDDAFAALRWIHDHGPSLNVRSDAISIGGISAGGHICAALQQMARDAGIPLSLVPATVWHGDYLQPTDSPFPSMTTNQHAPCLDWARLFFFRNHYVPKTAQERDVLFSKQPAIASPLFGRGGGRAPNKSQDKEDIRHSISLANLCDTFVATAELDPLCDEGEEYARRLAGNGVRVSMRRYTGVPHPFMHMVGVAKAQLYMDDVCGELARACARV
ncbi:Alpha/Beta hydrolase protein [Microdochium trichocladiopsis]|uniref:Alpha/Beta hydrolase protein n=1 Tax=Microdochium trichocladiopsis TaxID=1682393 RepID=A0A9P9BIM9_9PEZI|nr:Alpha/Beta hydrolase protein [Microdochium trichocladiopsis]KAH7014553.1 Alpha/Beta hydrolase protein [Microdochium trichocladiopsis]